MTPAVAVRTITGLCSRRDSASLALFLVQHVAEATHTCLHSGKMTGEKKPNCTLWMQHRCFGDPHPRDVRFHHRRRATYRRSASRPRRVFCPLFSVCCARYQVAPRSRRIISHSELYSDVADIRSAHCFSFCPLPRVNTRPFLWSHCCGT